VQREALLNDAKRKKSVFSPDTGRNHRLLLANGVTTHKVLLESLKNPLSLTILQISSSFISSKNKTHTCSIKQI
jgi:hypothetical protein